MTVALTTGLTRLMYTGPGAYNFQFQVYDPDTDLVVTHISADTRTETILTYGAATDPGYSAVLDQSYNGVVTVVDTGNVLGTTGFINIARQTPLTQLIDWLNAGPMNMDTLERCFDKLTMICQEFQDQLDSFTLSFLHKGSWAADTDYAMGDIVLYNGSYYVCMIEHTSTSSFNTDYWVEVLDADHTHTVAAVDVSYDGSGSGLTGNVQAAIDEVAALVSGQPERYRGLHDASSTVVPTWADLTAGDYGYISVSGAIGGVNFSVGDRIIYNGATWDRILAISGLGKNLFRNPSFQLDATGLLDLAAASVTEIASVTPNYVARDNQMASGWYKPVASAYNAAPDYLSGRQSLHTVAGSGFKFTSLVDGGEYHRGFMAQMLDTSLASLEGREVTISAGIQQGSLAVYVIPKVIGSIYELVSLAAIVAYKVGTLTASNLSTTGVFPTPGGVEDGYLVLLVDMKTDYTDDDVYSCVFSYLKCEVGPIATMFVPPSVNEEIDSIEQYAESSLETGTWTFFNNTNDAWTAGWKGAINFILPKAIGNATGPVGNTLLYRKPKRGTSVTGSSGASPWTVSPGGQSSCVYVAGISRSINVIYSNLNGFQLKNMSGVTFADQSQVGYHYFALYELL